MPFCSMLSSTLGFVLEKQIKKLPAGDCLYYLCRIKELDVLEWLDGNSADNMTV